MKRQSTGTKSSNDNRVFIAVMGPTGVGKSTFINLASGSHLRVGEGLESTTDGVHVSRVFDLDGRRVTLLDTPGFDDTNKSDTEILGLITAFLEELHRKKMKLVGVIYIHRISDFRMGGSSSRNFKLFCNLCGSDALKNSVIVTNMWGEVDAKKGLAREAELRDKFFKPAIDNGAKLERHDNTAQTAHKILRLIVSNRPLPLRIQIELVDEKKKLLETVAGAELNREILEETRKQEAEMKKLREEMAEAIREKDEETREELVEATQELQQKMDQMKHELENLKSAHLKQKTMQKQRVRDLTDEAPKEDLLKDYQLQKTHPTRVVQQVAESSQKERGKKQQQAWLQLIESPQRALPEQQAAIVTSSSDKNQLNWQLLVEKQEKMEQRLQQVERELADMRRQFARYPPTQQKDQQCIVQ